VFDPSPRIGFLVQARQLAAGPTTSDTARLIFNNRLDAVVTGVLVAMVALVLLESTRQWLEILSGKKELRVSESPFVMTQLAEEGQG
jgi:hypothetical protein